MTNTASFIQQFISGLIFVILVTDYIFTSRAIYCIGKKLNLRKVGFIWVPFVSALVLANVSDQIENKEDSTKKPGKMLRATTITAMVIMLFTLIVFLYAITNIRHALFIREVAIVFNAFLYMMFLAFAFFLFLRFIFAILCTYKVFKQIEPDKAVKYLLISLVLPLAKAFLLQKCKNKFYKTEEYNESKEIAD